jgi:RNA-binding protein YlmH
MKSLLVVLVVCVASSFAAHIDARSIAQKDLLSTIVSSLGLDAVWSTIQGLGSSVYLQFVQIGTQLLFAGQQIWAQVTPILNQLKDDLINHSGDALTIVAQAIASLNQVIGKRDLSQKDLLSTIVSSLGLDGVWSTIQGLGSSVYLQFVQIGTQLLFAGQQIWAQVTPILNQLKDDLINHTGDALTIVAQAIASLNQVIGGSGKRDLLSTIVSSLGLDAVWSTIQGLGSSFYLQFVQIGTQLLFAGQQIWAQVTPVLNQLKDDLLNHTGDAVTIVAQAIASLNQIIG